MGRKGSSYENLVKTYNRYRRRANKVLCECGKHLYESQKERHLQTKMHFQLMEKKRIYEIYLEKEKERKIERLEYINKTLTKIEHDRLKLLDEKRILEQDSVNQEQPSLIDNENPEDDCIDNV